MTPQMIGVLVDKGINVVIAIAFLLLAYRKIGPVPGTNMKLDKWLEQWGKTVKIAAWVMLVCFVPLLLVDIARVTGK
jgi:hypothetical protein